MAPEWQDSASNYMRGVIAGSFKKEKEDGPGVAATIRQETSALVEKMASPEDQATRIRDSCPISVSTRSHSESVGVDTMAL